MIDIKVQKKLHGEKGTFNLTIDLQIEEGTCLAVIGESGAGKTTLLRMISGLIAPDQGHIKFDGKTYFDSIKKLSIPTAERQIGFVFQDFALFPNMTIEGNLLYALQSPEDTSAVVEMLKLFNLTELKNKKPSQISGGQKQRVALARALVRKPKLLLLDEPLSSLDPGTRDLLQDRLGEIIKDSKLTTILVSHDSNEIKKLAQNSYRIPSV